MGFAMTAFMIFIILLFAMSLLVACLKRGLLRPLMSRGWFEAFNTEYIADQLVLEIQDFKQELRRKQQKASPNTSASVNEPLDITEDDEAEQSQKHKGDASL